MATQKGRDPRAHASTVHLSQFLASAGLGSRRSVEGLIRQGRVEVNGETAAFPGPRVDPDRDRVTCDGERVRGPRAWIYLMMNKPAGYVTTRSDELGRKTVDELLGRWRGRVVPIGRLDRATEGLLLFTNHGELAHRLLHPRYRQPRTYLAWVQPAPTLEILRRIEEGVDLGAGVRSGEAEARLLGRKGPAARVRITLREGKNREVRRIFKACGVRVLALRRTAYSGIRLGDDLAPGGVRLLEAGELALLAKATRLPLLPPA